MTENKKTRAYVDGAFYMVEEKKCSVCGHMTNRLEVETGIVECVDCSQEK